VQTRMLALLAVLPSTFSCVPPAGQAGQGGPPGQPGQPGQSWQGAQSGRIEPVGADREIVDRFRAAGDRCGRLSKHTVPAGWNVISVGPNCTGWVPGDWRVGPPNESLTTASDPGDQIGFLQIKGVPPSPITCTSQGVAQALMSFVNSIGCTGARLLAYGDTVMQAMGAEQQLGLGVFTCTRGPLPIIGFSLTTGTYEPVTGICNMWIQAYWLAQGLIDSHTCVLKQIGESFQCTAGNTMEPDEVGCWPDRCAQHCAERNQRGYCDGPVCRCE